MKSKKGILLIIILLWFTTISAFYYKTPVKRTLLKTYKEFFGNKHNSELVSNTSERDVVWGIDISHHQKAIDWKILVEKNKPDFIFLKATEGSTHKDTKYSTYLKKAREHGIPVGAYHFFSYQSSGKSQAENFIKNAKLKVGDMYPVLDVEFKTKTKDKAWIIREISSFSEIIKKEYGVYPILYCECDYYNAYLKNDFEDFDYWISDLYREPRCDYTIWQYTDNGFVHGIGKIDNNRFHKEKNIRDFLLSKTNVLN